MMIAALCALAAAAVAGLFLASRHFLRKRMPAWGAFLHGLGGATGFTLVLLSVLREPNYQAIRNVLYILIVTIVLGAVNLLFHIRGVRHRTTLILLHGFTAVTGAGSLIYAILEHPSAAPAVAAPVPANAPASTIASAAPRADSEAPPAAAVSAAPPPTPTGSTAPPETPSSDELAIDPAVRATLAQAITFEVGSTNIQPDSLGTIADIARTMNEHPELTLFEVQGHADERGADARNVALTRSRAQAVVEALVRNGVARARLHSAGYGSRCPADQTCRTRPTPAACHDASQWQRDRRVVFLVLQAGGASFHGTVACDDGTELIPAADRRFNVPGTKNER